MFTSNCVVLFSVLCYTGLRLSMSTMFHMEISKSNVEYFGVIVCLHHSFDTTVIFSGKRYQLTGNCTVNHLLYMDDIKLYAKSDDECFCG